jgi:hypothetical protein
MQVNKTFESESVEAALTLKDEKDFIIIGVLPNFNDKIEPITLILTKKEAESLIYNLMDIVCK